MVYRPTVTLDPVQQQYQRRYWQLRIGVLLVLAFLWGAYWLELLPI